MDMIGTISEWDAEKGQGFITVSGQPKRIFFQLADVSRKGHSPKVDEYVRFHVTKDVYGSIRATDIETPTSFNFSSAIAVWFASVLCASVYLFEYSLIATVFYFLVSAITYAIYAFDKSAEQHGGWRIPLFSLYFLSLIGGWPGALLAQGFLYYRYHDDLFKVLLWFTALANFTLYCWTLSPHGNEQMYRFIGYVITLLK